MLTEAERGRNPKRKSPTKGGNTKERRGRRDGNEIIITAVTTFEEETSALNVHVEGQKGRVCDAKIAEYPGKSIPSLCIVSPLLSLFIRRLDHQALRHRHHRLISVVTVVRVLRRLTGVLRHRTGTRALQRSRPVLTLVVPALVEQEAAARDPDRQSMATGVCCEDFDAHGDEKRCSGDQRRRL